MCARRSPSANANSPKGTIDDGGNSVTRSTPTIRPPRAADYLPLIVAYRNGAPVRLTDIADVRDSVEDLRNEGLANGKPAVLLILFRQPGANIIEPWIGVKAELPHLAGRDAARYRNLARRATAA